MVIILAIIIAILVIALCIMLDLYFTVSKKANSYEHERDYYSDVYKDTCNKMYSIEDRYHIELTKTEDLKKEVDRMKATIKRLRKELDDGSIHIVKTHLMTEWHNGTVDIPMEFLQDVDMTDRRAAYEITKFNIDLQDKLIHKIGLDVLKNSTGFALDYSRLNNSCTLMYKYPVFEQSEVLRGYLKQVNPDDDLAIWNLIQAMRKEECEK